MRVCGFRNFLIVFFFILFFCAVSSGYVYGEGKQFVVTIDAGHGGHDPGALGSVGKEKTINLGVSLQFGKLIEENNPEIKVVYTRKTDVFIPLQGRADIANNAHSDLFVCIHTNSCPSPDVKGCETYTLGLTKSQSNLDVAMRENSVILLEDNYKVKYAGFNPKSVDSYIMFECIQNKYIDRSVSFASDVQKNFVAIGRKDKGVRQAGFWVLHRTSMPAALIEVGYITNKDEEQFLLSSAGQRKLAGAIYEAFNKFYKESKRKSGQQSYVEADAFSDIHNVNTDTVSTKHIAIKKDTTSVDSSRFMRRVMKSKSSIQKKQPSRKNREQSKDKQNQMEAQRAEQKFDRRKSSKSSATDKVSKTNEAGDKKSVTPVKKAKKSKSPSANNTKQTYKLQIFAVSKQLPGNSPKFKGLNVDYTFVDGKYKYTYGNTDSYSEIQKLKKRISDKFPDAIIKTFNVTGDSSSVSK